MHFSLFCLQGIGDSAQGLANAILFCALTKPVRTKLQKALKSVCFPCCRKSSSTSEWEAETTTQLDSLTSERETAQPDEVSQPLITGEYGIPYGAVQQKGGD